jgi:hypothetical protein
MNKREAQQLVEKHLHKKSDQYDSVECVVLQDKTIEKEWGWVFFYQSREYLETADFSYMLVGNAPYIVNRNTGEIVITGTAYPVEHYIQEYELNL